MNILYNIRETLASIWPWSLFCIVVSLFFNILQELVDYNAWIQKNIGSTAWLSTVGTTLGFLVASTLATFIGKNQSIIGEYANLTGAAVNIATYTRGLTRINHPTLSLLLQSLVFLIKYEFRDGTSVSPSKLPLAPQQGGRHELLMQYTSYTSSGLSPFRANLLMISSLFTTKDDSGLLDSRDVDIIYRELRALVSTEGALSALLSYAKPETYTFIQNVLFVLFFTGQIAVDFVPNNGYNAVWTSAVFAAAFTALMRLASRYANPFNITTESALGQASFISNEAKGAAKAIQIILGKPTGFGYEAPSVGYHGAGMDHKSFV